MKRVLTVAAMLAATGGAHAAEIAGRYTVQGAGFDGQRYTGTASIEMTGGTTCRILWDTGAPFEGICMVRGDVLSAAYTGNGMQGLAVYQIMPDGTLDGEWTMAGDAGLGVEILVPARTP